MRANAAASRSRAGHAGEHAQHLEQQVCGDDARELLYVEHTNMNRQVTPGAYKGFDAADLVMDRREPALVPSRELASLSRRWDCSPMWRGRESAVGPRSRLLLATRSRQADPPIAAAAWGCSRHHHADVRSTPVSRSASPARTMPGTRPLSRHPASGPVTSGCLTDRTTSAGVQPHHRRHAQPPFRVLR